MPSTMAVTILPNAAPMTTPTARSTTFPRETNSLNSAIRPILTLPEWMAAGAAPDYTQGRQGGYGLGEDLALQHHGRLLAGVVQSRLEHVARLQRSDPGGRTHEDEVASAQVVQLRQLVEDVRDVPDQVAERTVLAQF